MEVSQQQTMDFDHWSSLAQHDPEAFEAMRRTAINELIEAAPPAGRKRLRRLQWRIDQERRLARTSLGACIRISNLMWDSLTGSGGLLEQIEQLKSTLAGESGAQAGVDIESKVVPFPSRHN